MAWKLNKAPETILANPKIIDEFFNMEPVPHERPKSERRLMIYERIWRGGKFRPVTWASGLCEETHMTHRVNGQHTSTLLEGFKEKLDKMPPFWITIERYTCKTLKDLASLYGTFDSNIASRTNADINASFAGTLPELDGVPMRLINLAVTAAAFHKWSEAEQRRIPPAEKAEEILDRVEFVKWLRGIVGGVGYGRDSLAKHLMRSPVTCAMMATYDRLSVVSTQFWVSVRDESAPDRNDPTRTLARYLNRVNLAGGNGMKGGPNSQKLVAPREMYVKCIHAWNAWREGKTPVSLSYHPASELPKVSK